jgi:hypothetical protein
VNRFYGKDLRAYEILSEDLDVGSQCKELYEILEHHEDMFERVIEAKTRQAAVAATSMATAHVQRVCFVLLPPSFSSICIPISGFFYCSHTLLKHT